MVESVDTPDLKSVDHHGRGSSSLPTRTKINKTKRGAYVFFYLQGNSISTNWFNKCERTIVRMYFLNHIPFTFDELEPGYLLR